MADITALQGGSESQPQGRSGGALAREFGFFAVFVFGVAAIGLSAGGMLPFSTVVGVFPGVDLPLVLTVALGLCIFPAYTYAVIGTIAPRPGADYVIGSRVLSKPLAFASSWTFVIFSALIAGTLIAQIPQTFAPFFFRAFGMIGTPIPAMINLAVTVSLPENAILIATILLVVVFMLMLLPQRATFRILAVGFVLGIISWAIVFYQLYTAPIFGFQVAWNRVSGMTGTYLQHMLQSDALGMNTPTQMGASTLALAGVMLGFWVFFGYLIPTLFAGEVKRPERNLFAGSLASLVFTWAVFVGASLLLLRLVPIDWLSSESFLYQLKSFEGLAIPWIPFYAAVINPSPALSLLVFIGWMYTLLNLAQAYIFYCSRILLAWVDDGLLPAPVAIIHQNMKSPGISVLIVSILVEVGVLNAVLNGSPMAQTNFVTLLAGGQIIPVLAVTLLPFIKKDWFEASSRFARLKIGPLPVITLVGLITLVYLAALLVLSFLFPVMGGMNLATLILFVAVFASGLIWYAARKRFAGSQAQAAQPASGSTAA